MSEPSVLLLFIIGLLAGVLSGLFGIGGGVVIVPALIYVAGFRQHMATGTSLAILLPPIGIAAAYEYYRHGNVNVRAAAIIAVAVLVGGWLGAVGVVVGGSARGGLRQEPIASRRRADAGEYFREWRRAGVASAHQRG